MKSNQCRDAPSWRATESKDWRSTLSSSTPAFHRGSSISLLSEPPVAGQVIRFPPVKVPETSVLWEQLTEKSLGSPWAHPALVIGVEGGLITCLQMTSKDVVNYSKCQRWADRYWPVSHNGKADHHTDRSERRKVWLLPGSQMEKLTHVNLEQPVTCEWHHFSNFKAGTAKGPRLEEESLQRLLQSQPYAYRPEPIPAPSVPVFIRKDSHSPLGRSSPPPPAIFSPVPSPTSSPATSPASSRSQSLDMKALPTPSVEKYVPPWKRQATGTGQPAPRLR